MSDNDQTPSLDQLYQNRKAKHKLTHEQKKRFIKSGNQQVWRSWTRRAQFAIALSAIAVFSHLALNQHTTPSHVIELDQSHYHHLAVVDLTSNTQDTNITVQVNRDQEHQRLLAQKQSAVRTLAQFNSAQKMYGKLVMQQDDWFIESCDKTLLVKVKKSVLAQLKQQNKIDTQIQSGDWLQLDASDNQLIALTRTHEPMQCNLI